MQCEIAIRGHREAQDQSSVNPKTFSIVEEVEPTSTHPFIVARLS